MPTSIAALALALGLGSVAALPGIGGLEIDREGGEVRFPCRFVNPSRILEVFACHNSGPAHETVVELDVSGPEIYKALIAIGARPASYWNAMGPDHFDRNQGDRFLVLVRWEHRGERHELPAESLLTDGQTEFPMLVRGFSFGARGRAPGPETAPAAGEARDGEEGLPGRDGTEEPANADGSAAPAVDEAELRAIRETGVPRAIEISLGASLRQRPSHPLLTHPTTSRRLQPWMLAPYLDLRAVPYHRELVEKEVPATLILRRLRSEASLVEIARAEALSRGLDAQALYAAVLPIAREIDELKGRYEALIREGRALLARGKELEARGAEEKLAAAQAARQLFARGAWLGARIEERYLAWYGLEEELKVAWIEQRTDLPAELRQEAVVLGRSGFRFEPEMARREVQAAELDLPDAPGLPAEKSLRRQAAHKEIESLGIERDLALSRASHEAAAARARELAEKKEAYVLRLFEEEKERWAIEIRRHEARGALARSELAEIRGLLDGSWEARRDVVMRQRRRAERSLELTQLETRLLEALEEIRWSENDLAADDVPERQKGAAERLEAARKQEAELRGPIERLRKEIDKLPAE